METQHTPGPWYTSRDAVPEWLTQVTVHAEDGERVATVFQTEANACLIAAAPDLLSTARMVLAYTDLGNDAYRLVTEEEARAMLRAAIAKATGQDS